MFEHQYADVNGVCLHYVSEGDGGLILFLHGFPEFWYQWKDQVAEFGRDYQAVAPDMRGYNLSSKPKDVDQYQVHHLVEDVRALAEHLGHARFHLVGHDWGGFVAWLFAVRHPQHLKNLVIINAPHPGVFQRELRENPAQREASSYMLMLRSEQAETILSASDYTVLVDTVLRDGLERGYFTDEDREEYIRAWSQPGALTGALNYYRAAPIGPLADERDIPADVVAATGSSSFTVEVPTLVIWGENDEYLLPGNLEGLDRFVPDLTIKRVPDGSHWVVHEKPALVNSYIRDFITRDQPKQP